VEYEPTHRFSYVLRSGMPVREYRADVTLTASGSGTDIVWRGKFIPSVPGTGPLLRAFLRMTVGRLARGAARYAAGSR
jgi:Polyketide cyclase / dehydrase and lipid transport